MSFLVSPSVVDSHAKLNKPFFKDVYATIDLDDSIPCVRLELNGVPRSSEHYHFIQSKRLELIYREIKNYPKLHLLTDSTNAGPVLDEDVAHFKNTVVPEIEKAGVRYLAIVVPDSKFTLLTIKEMTEHTRVLTVKYFESSRDAKIWLKKMTLA
jgi:hypothetical protein